MLSQTALASPEVRRLMTIPGVGPVTALAIVSVIGDVSRFASSRRLVGHLGLDPRVRQSGERRARTGRISRAGQAHARGLLIEAAHSAIKTPGPLRAFYSRIAARRGARVALVATSPSDLLARFAVGRRQHDPAAQRQRLSALLAAEPSAPAPPAPRQ